MTSYKFREINKNPFPFTILRMVESRAGYQFPSFPDLLTVIGYNHPQAAEIMAAFPDQDKHFLRHSARTGAIAYYIAGIMYESDHVPNFSYYHVFLAAMGAYFHDIGKTRTPVDLPLCLFRQTHLEKALEIASECRFAPELTFVVLSHHDAIKSPPGYPSGPVYRRQTDIPFGHTDRRQVFPPQITEVARIVWFADKLDRFLNGYHNQKKTWNEVVNSLDRNFPPGFLSAHPHLAANCLTAVRALFYEENQQSCLHF
jgi:putative nucleotidyltransferase with HDIG domain